MAERRTRFSMLSPAALEQFIGSRLRSLPEGSPLRREAAKFSSTAEFIRDRLLAGQASAKLMFDDRKYKAKTFWEEISDSLKLDQTVTKTFNKRVKQVFYEVDIDNSGYVDRAEFYAAILLLYHKINSIPWGGRKPPPKRDFVMHLYDEQLQKQKFMGEENEHEEALSFHSFQSLCAKHFKYVLGSVSARMILVSLIFPLIATKVTSALLESRFVNKDNFEEWDTVFSSAFLTFMLVLYPYAEGLFVRRVYMDKNGFASF